MVIAHVVMIIQEDSISVFIGTWNMGGSEPEFLDPWVPANQYDLYVIGVQVRDLFLRLKM